MTLLPTATSIGAVIALAALAAVDFTGTDFSAATSNPGNSFEAASSFEKLRFASGSYAGNGADNRAITGVGFQPDAVIVKGNTFQTAVIRTSTMSGDASKPLSGTTALSANRIQSLDASGFTLGTDPSVNSSGVSYYWMAFKSASAELKLGSYTGNGSGQSITGLGFSPEYVATLSAGAQNAIQRFQGMGRSFRFDADTGTTTGITSLDGNGFSVGSDAQANGTGTTYHYLAFNEVAGRIDAGSYTGDGADNRDIAGVGFQPEYVLLRGEDTVTGRRGVHRPAALSGDSTLRFDPMFNASNQIQALQAGGFQIGASSDVNSSGVAYHHLALKDGGGSGSCSGPGSQTVQAVADAYIDQAGPSSNFGTSSDLFVQSKSGSGNRRTLVRFNLPTIPAGCSMTGATLRLFSTSAVTGRTIEAYRAAASWSEGTVTWSTGPGSTGSAATSPSGTGWRTWDVTSQVQAMYSPGPNDGFLVRDQTEDSAASPEQKYESRENTNDPELIVNWG